LVEVNCVLTRLNARENLGLVFHEAAGVALERAGGEDEIYVDGNEDILRSQVCSLKSFDFKEINFIKS
jgi:hypothetical protein